MVFYDTPGCKGKRIVEAPCASVAFGSGEDGAEGFRDTAGLLLLTGAA